MTKLCVFLFWMISIASAQHHHGEHPSVHGMFLMGKDKIYLSHLPMFHSPHDYQVIIEVQMDAASKFIYQKALKTHPQELVYTVEPEVFVLPDMIKKPRPFKAKVYLGHFERGGSVLTAQTTFKIVRVIYYKKFDPAAVHPQKPVYLLFGSETELFLAHKIMARPDFDQIVELKVRQDLLYRIKNAPVVEATDLGPSLGKVLYLEYGDLE